VQGGDLVPGRPQPHQRLAFPLGGIAGGGGPAEQVGKAVGFEHEGEPGEVAGHVGVADPRVQRLLQLVGPRPHLDERLGGLCLVLPGERQALPGLPQLAAGIGDGPVRLRQGDRQADGVGARATPDSLDGARRVSGLLRAAAAVLGAGRLRGERQHHGDGERGDDAGA